jgi:outer membrane murein-binding lipoprotein Lpp
MNPTQDGSNTFPSDKQNFLNNGMNGSNMTYIPKVTQGIQPNGFLNFNGMNNTNGMNTNNMNMNGMHMNGMNMNGMNMNGMNMNGMNMNGMNMNGMNMNGMNMNGMHMNGNAFTPNNDQQINDKSTMMNVQMDMLNMMSLMNKTIEMNLSNYSTVTKKFDIVDDKLTKLSSDVEKLSSKIENNENVVKAKTNQNKRKKNRKNRCNNHEDEITYVGTIVQDGDDISGILCNDLTNKKGDSKDNPEYIIKMGPPSGQTTQPPFMDPLSNIFSQIFSKLKSEKDKKQEEDDTDTASENSDYDSSDEFEDLGQEIKSIDDLIKLGELYPKLKNENEKSQDVKTDKSKPVEIPEKKESGAAKPIKGLFKKNRLDELIEKHKKRDDEKYDFNQVFGFGKPGGLPMKAIPVVESKDKKNHCYKLNGKLYPINLEVLFNLSAPLKKLKALVGLDGVKTSILDMILYYLQNFESKNRNMLHTVIEGPPGVGKTELGKVIGEIYAALGVIKSNKFRIVRRTDLVGEYLGQTAQKTQQEIDKADGGVLFIDEAYSLGADDKRDSFAKECIDTINQNLSEKKRNLICIIAGYKEELETCFFSYNPGLKRRFPFKYSIKGYSSEEMKDIFVKKVADIKWKISSDIKNEEIVKFFTDNESAFPHFGGDIENLLVACKFCHSSRVVGKHPKLRKILTIEDIQNGFEQFTKHRGEVRSKREDYHFYT